MVEVPELEAAQFEDSPLVGPNLSTIGSRLRPIFRRSGRESGGLQNRMDPASWSSTCRCCQSRRRPAPVLQCQNRFISLAEQHVCAAGKFEEPIVAADGGIGHDEVRVREIALQMAAQVKRVNRRAVELGQRLGQISFRQHRR